MSQQASANTSSSIKKRLLSFIILLTFISFLNAGCAGVILRSMAVGNEGTYSVLSKSFPAIPEGKGRVFIYMTEGGPSLINTLGIITTLTIDNNVYYIAGAAFFYAELEIGKHKVTASKMQKGVFKKTLRLGENIVDFELLNQDVKFIRIDFKGTTAFNPEFNSYFPVLLESNINAENEISSLKFFKNHMTSQVVGIEDED